jgi:lipoprotein-releasing system permease protein
MSYEFFISLRYLRAKRKQVFVSIITFISITGIFLGVAALIIVLAVMNGFETDLREKILGINAHVVLMQYTGMMKDHERVKEAVEQVDGVVASTPFIYSQAMLKKGDNVHGIVLRGLSPADASKVINLGKTTEGGLDLLTPEGRRTLKLGPDATGLPGIVIDYGEDDGIEVDPGDVKSVPVRVRVPRAELKGGADIQLTIRTADPQALEATGKARFLAPTN